MPMKFKTPDGKEFDDRSKWRDYMMTTFYTFKNKVDEPLPLIKKPGDVGGQVFDISDSQNSTMVIMDNSEQVQIDNCKRNCRIFIGACASAVFIRNCEDCVFYVCTKQLRLRECYRCKLYVMSWSEVHIEMSKDVAFAPFNGGYPEHAEHLSVAGIDLNHNLWYDVFDHNDPGKTHENWSLIPVNEYEEMWFPAGPCEPAIKRTAPGTVDRVSEAENMQSFGADQLIADSKTVKAPSAPELPPALPPALPPVPPPPAAADTAAPELDISPNSAEFEVLCVLNSFVNFVPGSPSNWAADGLAVKLSNGTSSLVVDATLPVGESAIKELWNVESITIAGSGDFAWAAFWVHQVSFQGPEPSSVLAFFTAVCQKTTAGVWQIVHLQRSADCDPTQVAVPKME